MLFWTFLFSEIKEADIQDFRDVKRVCNSSFVLGLNFTALLFTTLCIYCKSLFCSANLTLNVKIFVGYLLSVMETHFIVVNEIQRFTEMLPWCTACKSLNWQWCGEETHWSFLRRDTRQLLEKKSMWLVTSTAQCEKRKWK